MLKCGDDQPNQALGDYVDLFLAEAPWLRRRVETISFLDYDTVIRRSTFDIGSAELVEAIDGCPLFSERPLVPLTTMKKELLTDFSLRDRSGGALAVAPRDVDTFFAWSLLCLEANRALGVDLHGTHPAVSNRLREVAFNFPDLNDQVFNPDLLSWSTPEIWHSDDKRIWRALQDDQSFSRLLRDFTFNFLLLTQLDLTTSPHLNLVKLSYQQHLPYSELEKLERLGLRETELDVTAPTVGSTRSYHLQVEAPEGVSITNTFLVRIDRQPAASPRSAESYEARIGPQTSQIYTTPAIRPAEHAVAVTMRVRIDGYVRSVWLTTVAAATILVVGRFLMNHVQAAVDRSTEAAVALLLVAPSLLAAYLVRPDEHAIASRLLRPIRYCVAFAGCLTFTAAASLVLRFPHPPLHIAWTVFASLAGAIAAYITLVVILTTIDLKAGRGESTDAERRLIAVLPYQQDDPADESQEATSRDISR